MTNRTNNPATGKIGRAYPPVSDEAQQFYICPHCGQAADKRHLGEVFHHEIDGHKPLPPDA